MNIQQIAEEYRNGSKYFCLEDALEDAVRQAISICNEYADYSQDRDGRRIGAEIEQRMISGH